MIEPTKDDIGRSVIYTGTLPGRSDKGVITSYNDHYVFVRYGDDYYSRATYPKNLLWEEA